METSVQYNKTGGMRVRRSQRPKTTTRACGGPEQQQPSSKSKNTTKRVKVTLPNQTDAIETTMMMMPMTSMDTPIPPAPPKKSKVKHGKIFAALHLGAGTHSVRNKDKYEALCIAAMSKMLAVLRQGGTAEEAVVEGTCVLEDSGQVNAGRGSNLTIDNNVECDAGFMSGDLFFGGVGAVPCVPNPILVAKKLSELQEPGNKLSCGRVPPSFLVGQGAKLWAESQGIKTCSTEQLISKKSAKTYAKYIKLVKDHEVPQDPNDRTEVNLPPAKENKNEIEEIESDLVLDTVGAIALDDQGRVAATVSSGGNWLKFPGRVGHSPLFGCGCWASNSRQGRSRESDSAVAVSTTGVGEMLTKIQWASLCASVLSDPGSIVIDALSETIRTEFLESNLLRLHDEPKIIGLIGLKWEGVRGEFVWGHTSRTLVVGYGGSGFKEPKMIFSTLPSGKSVEVGGFTF